ncbi:hypothetical protein DIZ27_41720 [Streptomyces sp. NWU339]|uniref:DnaB-like helicase C-terminal domain-containing protein n=1 Tax=Streptomyces sp. NWU339 TaxID=2185284 RepID=UPI000D678809|nr:DnaB-like helicase C-terminal domain-containing protein [Streptomyces sp. NWU339]PWI05043.1 hypothetical protein DIZ27_41720 [Streptomyces sp. NWU339]
MSKSPSGCGREPKTTTHEYPRGLSHTRCRTPAPLRSHAGEAVHKTCVEAWIAADPTEFRLGLFTSGPRPQRRDDDHTVRSRIKGIIRETGRAPLVVVDYLQLMETDQRSARQSPYERVTEISRELKILAADTGAVLIAPARLDRGLEQRQDKRSAVSDLRDSGALEQDAEAILLLHREDHYEPESGRAGESDLIAAKQRNGPTATVTVAHQFPYSRPRDMSAPEEPAP